VLREQWYRFDQARWRELWRKVALSPDGMGFNVKPLMFDLFTPTWSCDVDIRFGGAGDGGKFFCDPHKIRFGDCLVYSFGLNTFTPYEQDVKELLNCEIHGFDPTPGLDFSHINKMGIKTHVIGMAESDTQIKIQGQMVPAMTLESIINMLGHQKRKIDVLKMDIESYEWPILMKLGQTCHDLPPIDRINVELHWWGEAFGMKNDIVDLIQIFMQLDECGYRLYHAEPHLKRVPQVVQASEFSWVHERIIPHSTDALDPLEVGKRSWSRRS